MRRFTGWMRDLPDKFRRWIYSLQGKFILVAFVCILVFTSIGSLILVSREEALYRQDLENQGKALVQISRLMVTNVMVYNELGIINDQELVDYFDYFIIQLMERDKRVKSIVILNATGRVLAHSDILKYGETFMDKPIRDAIDDLKTEIAYKGSGKDTVLRITTPLNIDTKNWGVLQFGLSTKEMRASINSLKRGIAALNFIFSMLSLAIISLGANVLSKPVVKLSEIMDGIKSHGDLERQHYNLKDRRDEIGKLQNSFQWMLQRLREADREHKKTLEVLSQTEKMVSIGRLASGVAHEINNPLSGVTLCFENLMETGADNAKKEKLVQAIRDGNKKIKFIVEHLLDFSRMTIPEKTSVDIKDLLNSMIMFVKYSALKKNINIVSDISDDIPLIMIDNNKMSQVFLNIMINAIYAMEGGGNLTIKAEWKDNVCMVYIKDTGAGILSSVMPYIFDPFFTTKGVGEGTGLGLSLSKGIVEQHGGTIEVESEIGVGSTFCIKLPLTAPGHDETAGRGSLQGGWAKRL